MIRTDDPYYDADVWQDELERQYANRPHCSECGERIREEFAYRLENKLVCSGCLIANHQESMIFYD